jgi:polysaccharide deacetylase family protein (PEP-CTERM system associated)
MQGKNSGKKLFILTIDLEEWFHILDIKRSNGCGEWSRYETRIFDNTSKILHLFRENNLKATFFVLGWIAKKYPDLVRQIANEGHEICSHSLNHILVYQTSPKIFREDLKRSIDLIQNLTHKRVRAYRAPGFSITRETLWAFKIISEEGIEIDSSIFPAPRAHGGISDFPLNKPFLIKVDDMLIKEFPINIYNFCKIRIPFSGGGYFRICPFLLIYFLFNNSDYIMTYFHPRDFDTKQPVIKELSLFRKLKSYYGLKKSYKKFQKLLKSYHFVDIETANHLINWESVPIFEIKQSNSDCIDKLEYVQI